MMMINKLKKSRSITKVILFVPRKVNALQMAIVKKLSTNQDYLTVKTTLVLQVMHLPYWKINT